MGDKIKNNEWETNLDEIVSLIKDFTKESLLDRVHIISSNCNYVSLRFDMRDGAFIILDRGGKRIEFEELKKVLEAKYE